MTVQSDAPVFIVLGTLTVLTGMAAITGVLNNFGGGFDEAGGNTEAFDSLYQGIDSQCSRYEEYGSALGTTVEFRLSAATIEYDSPDLVLDEDSEDSVEREIECLGPDEGEVDISFNPVEIDEGSWEASINEDSGEIKVEVEE